MRRFDYYRPSTVAEATSLLREHGEGGMILAGGTDLLVQVKEGHRRARYLVSLAGIEGLRGIEALSAGPTTHGGDTSPSTQNGVSIGARTLMQEIAADPAIRARYSALADGAGVIGSIQTRNMATIGGNVCNAAPSADTSPPLVVLDARVHTIGPAGERELPIVEFWTGPGRTVLELGEVVTRLSMPEPPARSGSYYERHTPRKTMDIAAVGIAVYLELDASGVVTQARVSLGAVAPTVVRAPAAEAALVGRAPDENAAADAARAAASEARPISDQRGSAEFRSHLVEVMTKHSVLRAAERARG